MTRCSAASACWRAGEQWRWSIAARAATYWRSASAPALRCRYYAADRRITGIDLSAEMLAQARKRVADREIANVAALREMDAEATDFPDASFDIAVAMFVASVVPHPRALLAEMRRVVRPGGNILFVSHFAAEKGPLWWIERAMAPASRALGWHPDFAVEAMFAPEDLPQYHDHARAAVRHLHAGAAGGVSSCSPVAN